MKNAYLSCISLLAASVATLPALAQESSGDAESRASRANEEIVVTGLRARTGVSRFDVELKDLPQAVQIVTAKELDTFAVTRIEDALNFTPGVLAAAPRGGAISTGFFVRGFQNVPVLFDGYNFGFSQGFQEGIFDISVVESAELLRGPAAVLYGQGSPGGVINLVMKKPQEEFGAQVDALYGRFDTKRAEIDVTGPIAGGLKARIVGVVEDNDSFRDFVTSDRLLISPRLTWEVNDTLTLDGFYYYDRLDFVIDRGFGLGQVVPLRLPRSTNLAEPWVPESRSTTQTIKGEAAVRLTEDLTAKLVGVRTKQTRGGFVDFGVCCGGTPEELERYLDVTQDRDDNYQIDSTVAFQIAGGIDTGSLRHNIFLEAANNTNRSKSDVISLFPYTSIDATNIVYSPPIDVRSIDGDRYIFASKTRQRSLSFQDLIEVTDKFNLSAGIRYDWVRLTSAFDYTFLDGSTDVGTSEQREKQFTYRFGAVYKPTDMTSLYVSYGTSFLPQSGLDRLGNPLSPEEGSSLEGGIKQELLNRRLALSLAVYEIKKKGLLTIDQVDPNFNQTAGEARSRGFEVEMEARPARGTSLRGGISYVDAKITESNLVPVGDRLPGAPKWSFSLAGEQTLVETDNYSFSVNGLVSAVTKYRSALPNDMLVLPGYTRVDLGAAAKFSDFTVQFNLRNAFNAYYLIPNGYGLVAPGAPRTWLLSLRYNYGSLRR